MERWDLLVVTVVVVGSAAGVATAELPYQNVWTRQIGSSTNDVGCGVSVDSLGNIYMVGQTLGGFGSPAVYGEFVCKYDPQGSMQWARPTGGSSYYGYSGISVDEADRIFVGGNQSGTGSGFADARVIRYNTQGQVEWTRNFGSVQTKYYCYTAARNGNVYVAGDSYTGYQVGGWDAYLARYDAQGNQQWNRTIGSPQGTFDNDDHVRAVTADDAGNVYITGNSPGAMGGAKVMVYDSYLLKYDVDGNRVWGRQIGSMSQDSGEALAVDSLGNVYVAGRMGDKGSVSKYAPDGTLAWSREATGGAGNDMFCGLAVDAAGNVFASGRTNGAVGGSNAGELDVFLCKFDAHGAQLWAEQLGSPAVDMNLGLALDRQGNAYLCGYTEGNLGGTNLGGRDLFLAKFSPVPEPMSLALLGIGAAVLIRRRGGGATCRGRSCTSFG